MVQPSAHRRAVVVANGSLPDLAPFRTLLETADLVIGADGGAQALLSAGIRTDILLGDFDSLDPTLLHRWQQQGGTSLIFPADKDQTDLEIALHYAVENDAREIVVLGALGGRLDHELANVLLLAAPFLSEVSTAILDVQTRAVAVRREITLRGKPGDLLSLLPVGDAAQGVWVDNAAYGLHGETLTLGPSRGVSNVLMGDTITVRVADGILLAVHTWPDARTLEW
jgi:thiamine pyrophosphokinase